MVEAQEEIVADIVISEDDNFGSRPARVARQPNAPTKADIDAHLPLHAEYRDWCPSCVAGKGISHQHRTHTDEEPLGNTVSCDYAFHTKEELEDHMCPILVAYDHTKWDIWALPIEQKGAIEPAIKWMLGKMDIAGYRGMPVTLKSDGESAVVALKNAVATRREAETPLIKTPARESKSNGAMENAVRQWRGQFRTLRHYFEHRLGTALSKEHPMMGWLVIWTSDVLGKWKVHKNGRTSYEMCTQHRCRHQVYGFGEKVHFKMTTDKAHHQKSVSEWQTGYFLGIVEASTAYIVCNATGAYACTTIKRLPDDESYDKACLDEVKVTVFEYFEHGIKTRARAREAICQRGSKSRLRTSGSSRWRLRSEKLQDHSRSIGKIWSYTRLPRLCIHSVEGWAKGTHSGMPQSDRGAHGPGR